MKGRKRITFFISLFIGLSFGVVAESYKGSQAYNHANMFRAQVNTATGTFSFSYPLIDMPGRREPLKIHLDYKFNAEGMFGLPTGWCLDLDYISDKTAEISGKQWIIDNEWHDETGYASGLKYYNQHGSRFEDAVEARPIPGFKQISYRYKTTYKDGSVHYFSHQGLIVLRLDRFNNAVQFFYVEPVSKLESARLLKIIDNYGNTYRFEYEPQTMAIHYPDGREQRVYFNAIGVNQIINPLKQVYHITYTSMFGQNLIRTIASPEGLMTDLVYESIPYKDAQSSKELPVVIRFKQFDLADKKVHHEVNYQYARGNNYTGYPKYVLSDHGDSLMDSEDQSYRYSVNVIRVNGKQLNQKVYKYNYLHLPVEIQTQSEGKPYTKTTYQYDISPFKYSRSTNYDKPLNVTHWVWHGKRSGYVPSDKVDTRYDRYGNKLNEVHSVYDQTKSQWTSLKKTTYAYFTDHYSLLKEKVETDELSGRAIKKKYQLDPSGMTYHDEKHHYKPDSKAEKWEPWKQIQFTFDEQGRKTSTTTEWLMPDKPGVQSITKRINYHFNKDTSELEVTNVSDGHREYKRVIDTRNCQKIKEFTPNGELTLYTYDALNREQTRTDPEGNVITLTYQVFSEDKKNSVVYRSPLGDKHQTVLDASNRMIFLNDEYKGQWRNLLTQTYNGFGKITSKSDRLGLKTTTEYDEHERPVKTTDPFGNVHSFQYEDAGLATTTYINDRKRTVVTKQPWRRKTITQSFPVTNNTHDKPADFIETSEIHDGFKKLVYQSTSLVELSTQKTHSTVEVKHEYDAHQNPVLSNVITFDKLTMQKKRKFNLANKLFTWHKSYTIGEMSTFHEGYRYHYDGDGLLSEVESPALSGDHRLSTKHSYDTNGREIKRELQDGHVIEYQYNPRGLLITRSWQRNQKPYQVHHHYDAEGKLTAASDSDNQWVHYHYTQSGALRALHYPDNRSLILERDAYDRVYQQIDANGTMQKLVYKKKDKGLLSQIIADNSTINFYYGEDNNGKKGQLVQRDFDAEGTGVTQTHYTYGAQDRLIHTSSSNQQALLIFKVDYAYDALGELTQLTQVVDHVSHPKKEVIEYTYDGLRRLSNEKHILDSGRAETGDKNDVWERHYQYDGNDNLISEHSNDAKGTTESIEYFYNTMDQLANLKLNGSHSSIPIIYDSNGRLIKDHNGQNYAYDDAGYLLNTSTKGGENTAFHYWPNGVLGHAFKKQSHSDYYPDQHHSIQTVYKDKQWHSFIRQDSGIIGVKTNQGTGQGFAVNRSMGAYLQLLGAGDISFEEQHYDAYGKILDRNKSHSPVMNAFGWNQELNNPELGLTYLRHRFYSPELRRFVSRDSFDVDNRYAYVFANPVNYIDPTGHNAVVNYTLGSIFTSLGILGAALAVPTGGASLTLSSAAGIGAGVTSALSGMSLLGSQISLDAGNKAVAKALSSSSIVLSVLAIGQVVVSLAPTITNAFAQASRFFSSSSAAASTSATVEAAETSSLSASGEAVAKLNPRVAIANTEAIVSGWSIAATMTENTADLTTDIFADHAVGISMQRIDYGRMMSLAPVESSFPDNVHPSQHVWLTRIRGWLFKHLSAEDVKHYIRRCKIETVFSEDELRTISKPNVLDAFKRFGMQSEQATTGFSYYKSPLAN